MVVITRSSSSSNWIFSLKVLLASTGVLSMALILKLSVPAVLEFLASQLPLFWSSLLSWLTPPYLYVVINGIIVTIAASSRFHHRTEDDLHPDQSLVPMKVASDIRSDFTLSTSGYEAVSLRNPMDVQSDFTLSSSGYDSVSMKNSTEVRSDFSVVSPGYDAVAMKNTVELQSEFGGFDTVPIKNPVYEQREIKVVSEGKTTVAAASRDQDDDFVISRSTWTPIRRDSTEILPEYSNFSEKPPASARFNHRNKTVKASPDGGKVLGVVKPKRHDTLESTWKTITDGRPMPLTRHLKKSDTWESHGRHHHNISVQQDTSPLPMKMKKSETFTERNNNNNNNKNQQSSSSASPGSSSGGKLRKESSLSHDDLNRRVEAFIKKFNEEMRLQRQESLNQYKEMVNRGTHK